MTFDAVEGEHLISFNVRDEWLTTQDIDDVGREAHGNSIEDVRVHLHDVNTEGLEPHPLRDTGRYRPRTPPGTGLRGRAKHRRPLGPSEG